MQGFLVPSSIKGRYAILDADGHEGPDLTSGMSVEVGIDEHWLAGRVEYSAAIDGPGIYVMQSVAFNGYYVITESGSVLGLCTGMFVRTV